MKLALLLFMSLFNYAYVYDLCNLQLQDNMCSERHVLDNCKVKSTSFDSRDCSEIKVPENELNSHLGNLILQLQHKSETQLFLNLSFSNVKWNESYMRFSEDNNKNNNVCKLYRMSEFYDGNLYDSCLWDTARRSLGASPYLLEYWATNKSDHVEKIMYRKLLFNVPDANNFSDALPLSNRSIFAYVDFTNIQDIVVNIQTLPKFYNVARYKVEVYRERGEKNAKELLLTEFLNPAYVENELITYEYQPPNGEGHYFFDISAICHNSPEDNCKKTTTAKVYMHRKGTPLVVGIVGASFIIPFVLFIFHMWNHRFKPQGGLPDTVEKILILFKPSSDKHNDVVTTLAKTVKHLTGIEVMSDPVNLNKAKPKNADKWCSDNLILATYIIYIAPPENDENKCELDYMTYNFLKAEMKKSTPEKDVIILKFPYSTSDIPSILVNCMKFELMGDFQKFLDVFQPVSHDFNYENNINCMELMKKIELAQTETDRCENNDTPKIVITDQSEPSDEPKEIDVLL